MPLTQKACEDAVAEALQNAAPLTKEELAFIKARCKAQYPIALIVTAIRRQRNKDKLIGILKAKFPNLSVAEIKAALNEIDDGRTVSIAVEHVKLNQAKKAQAAAQTASAKKAPSLAASKPKP